ncbi:MAG: hypothetical protein OEL88_04925 [Sterolibacteriaceae bacterium MAG5]|nr:hypothetical protein [Candidatus Nitricoxidireducens bremensis]
MKSALVALFLLFAANLAAAETLACPSLATAVQVGTCPTEEELRYTFTGYCSDNARMYGKGDDTCASYQNYRKLKNIVLWESADGEFHAYLSCDLPAAAVKEARATGVAVNKQGTMTRVLCSYGEGIAFAHRTRAACKVEAPSCADGACKVNCEK